MISNIIHIIVKRIIGSRPKRNTLNIAFEGKFALTSKSSTKQSNENKDSFGFPILLELSNINVKYCGKLTPSEKATLSNWR